MFGTLVTSMGLDRFHAHEWVLLAIILIALSLFFGWIANYVSGPVCFSVGINAFVVFFSIWLGLITYNIHVRSLKLETATTIPMLVVAFAVAGLLGAVTLRNGMRGLWLPKSARTRA